MISFSLVSLSKRWKNQAPVRLVRLGTQEEITRESHTLVHVTRRLNDNLIGEESGGHKSRRPFSCSSVLHIKRFIAETDERQKKKRIPPPKIQKGNGMRGRMKHENDIPHSHVISMAALPFDFQSSHATHTRPECSPRRVFSFSLLSPFLL